MKKIYHTNLAFLDLLFNTLLCFAALFLLAFVMINPSKKKHDVESKAEFIITVTWPKEVDDDVDTYVEDPVGNLVCFMRREDGLMHLDRDDLGRRNDVMRTQFGQIIEYKENSERVSIRGIVAGEYVVNVHMYATENAEQEIPVSISLEKINPYSVVVANTVTLKQKADEKTAFRFVLDEDGKVKSVNYLEKNLTSSVKQSEP